MAAQARSATFMIIIYSYRTTPLLYGYGYTKFRVTVIAKIRHIITYTKLETPLPVRSMKN